MYIIEGKKIAEQILSKLREEVSSLSPKPTLAIIYAGKNEASEIYINKKIETAKEVGIITKLLEFDAPTTEELIKATEDLNNDPGIHGYIVQLPLPKLVEQRKVLANIATSKDIDGLSPQTLGALWHGNNNTLTSATALAVLECISYAAKIDQDRITSAEIFDDVSDLQKFLQGKNVLVINDSLLVGKPLAALLLKHRATVTIAHKETPSGKLSELIKSCDILVSATGKEGLITSTMIKDTQILIDVGINKTASGVGGDIDTKGMKSKNVLLTPVPNGVGPITVAMLLKNTLKAYKLQKNY